jgi:S-sulfo-L-cysteine synthase (3-phospho-L-serine-dependent)
MHNDSRCFTDYELPRLFKLAPNFYGASFHLMKLLPARYMLDQAERDGRLLPGGTICETTSGTFGLALAMLAAVRGYKLILVSDPAIDEKLKIRLQELGATVDIVERPNAIGGFQQARLDRLAKALRENLGSFCPSQYTNEDNPKSYGAVSEWIAERLGNIDCLVGTVGSGGSMSGTSYFFRHLNPDLNVIGVDTKKSVIFGQQDGKRLLRGLGNSLMPKNVDHTQFDEVHWVDAPAAFLATRKLHQKHGLFQGGTSGAAWLVADWWAKQNPGKTVLALFPDEGHRYVETIYSDSWLDTLPSWTGKLPEQPIEVDDPQRDVSEWSYFQWCRRPLDGVVVQIAEKKVA